MQPKTKPYKKTILTIEGNSVTQENIEETGSRYRSISDFGRELTEEEKRDHLQVRPDEHLDEYDCFEIWKNGKCIYRRIKAA